MSGGLTLEIAQTILSEALDKARALDLKPISVAVLDAGGHLKVFATEDGSSTHRFQIAFGKAHGAIALGVGSRALMKRAESQPYFISAAVSAIGGALIPVPGGVLISNEAGETVGAVGVSGDQSDNDEQVAAAGVAAAGLIPVTG